MKFNLSKESFSVNRGVVVIKIVVFLQNFGTRMMLPYLTLQMRSIGLSYNDIGLIYGAIPLLTFWSSSVSGFVGDKLGYRAVHIFNLLLMATAAACFDLTPRYREYTRIPTATIYREDTNSTTYKLASIQWPLCDQNVTISSCEASQPFLDSFENITSYLSCQANDGFQYDDDFLVLTPNVTENANGSYCFANIDCDNNNNNNGTDYQVCNITGYLSLPTCKDTEGKHSTTVWVYFALRVVFAWCINSAFAITDATGLRLASIHGSDYTYIQRFTMLAQFLCPFVAGALIQDAVEGSGEETNYNIAIYVGDAFLIATAIVALKLKVVMQKSGEKTLKSLKKIFSIPALNFFGLVFLMGFQWGIKETFLFIYLDEEMDASSQLLSYMLATGAGCGILATFIGKPIIQKFGNINVIAVSFWIDGARFFTYAYAKASPPYYGIALHALDAFTWTIPWAAAMTYGYKIAPPDLIATMAAATAAFQFIIGKGIAGLIGGLIVGNGVLTSPQLFQATAIFCISCSTILVLVYHLVLKNNHEKVLLEKKAALLARMKVAKEAKDAAVTDGEINTKSGNSDNNSNDNNSNDNNSNDNNSNDNNSNDNNSNDNNSNDNNSNDNNSNDNNSNDINSNDNNSHNNSNNIDSNSNNKLPASKDKDNAHSTDNSEIIEKDKIFVELDQVKKVTEE